MTELRFSGQAPSHVARHFLGLLDDVYRIHGLFLDEITALRARIAELEASTVPFVNEPGSHPIIPDVPGCAVYLVSQEGKIQSWSGGACAIYGYSVEEVIGQAPGLLRPDGIHPEEPGPEAPPSRQASLRRKKDGSVFDVYLHQAILLDKAGHACGRMHIEIPLEHTGTASLASRGCAS